MQTTKVSHRNIILLATVAAIAVAIFAVLTVSAQEPRGVINGVNVDADTPGQATISWDAVSDAKDYRVMFAKSGEDYRTWTDESGNRFPTTNAVTLTDLTEGETYKFRVRSRFEEEQDGSLSGPWSAEHTFTVARSLPAAPTGLTVYASTHQSVTLTWDDPNDDSISSYQILRRSRDGDEYGDGQGASEFAAITDSTDSAATTHTDTTAQPHSRYIYRIKARNTGGLSPKSSYANAETDEEPDQEPAQDPTATPPPNPTPTDTPTPTPTVPDAPTGLTTTSVSSSSVVLTWDASDDETVTSYQILRRNRDGDEYEDGQGATEFAAVADDTGSSATTYTDSSVTPRTRYVYRVQAKNANGMSPRSGYLNVDTPAFPPPATLAGLTVSAFTSESVTLEWDDPQDSTISKYQYRHRETEASNWDPDWTDVTNSGPSTTGHTVTGLTRNTGYTIELRAINPGGDGAVSSAQATPKAVPAAPVNLQVSPGDASAVLSWDDPEDSDITKYQYRVSSDKGATWDPDWTDVPSSDSTTTSHTVSGLDNGTSYTFEVRAVSNPKGKVSTIRATPRQDPMVIGNLPLGGRLPLFGTIAKAGERHHYRVQLEADKFYKIHICGCYTNETGFTKRQMRLLLASSGDPVQIDGRNAVSVTHPIWSGVYIYFQPTTTAMYIVEVRASDLRQTGEYELSAYDATITSSSANEQIDIFDFELHDLADLYASDPADPVAGDLDSDGRKQSNLIDVDYFEANLHSGRTYTFSFAASSVSTGSKFLWIAVDGPGDYRRNHLSPHFSGSSRTMNATVTPGRTGAYVFRIGIFKAPDIHPDASGAYTVTLTQS